jgi:hypothetical protein
MDKVQKPRNAILKNPRTLPAICHMIAVVPSVVKCKDVVVLCLCELVANIPETFTLMGAQQYQTN